MWDDHSPQNATFDPDTYCWNKSGAPYLLRQRIVTRLGMIFAKEVEVLSVDFSPERTALWTKTHGSLPMLEFFGGCIYICNTDTTFTSTKCFPDIYRKTCAL